MSKTTKVIGIINDCGKSDWGGQVKQICPTLKAEAHGNLPKVILMDKVKIKQATKQGYIECIEGGGGVHRIPRKQIKERQSD